MRSTLNVSLQSRRRAVMVSAAALSLVGGRAGAQSMNADLTRAAMLGSRWTGIAYERFARYRAFTSVDSGQMLERMIVNAAVRAVRERIGDDRLREADRNILRFAEGMLGAGQSQPNGTIRLGESSFAAAFKLCPLWPFC